MGSIIPILTFVTKNATREIRLFLNTLYKQEEYNLRREQNDILSN